MNINSSAQESNAIDMMPSLAMSDRGQGPFSDLRLKLHTLREESMDLEQVRLEIAEMPSGDIIICT